MLFNSYDYFIFYPIIILLYFIIPFRFRWILLLGGSYFFYMSWKAEYIVLIVFSTFIDYFCGLKMGSYLNKIKRRPYLYLSIFVNLGFLFSFKYFNFFNNNLSLALDTIGFINKIPAADLILPVGISFYTFQTMSYSIDVYNGRIKPERHLGVFALFVAFFPQLVAGPIERAGHLIGQLKISNRFNTANLILGMQLIIWGLFKKVVIADRLAIFVNEVYNNPQEHEGLSHIVATVFFAFQIYCDFSGYSDIAIGSAKIIGVDLMQNFRQPYFAKSIAEFWARWHISLSTWFRDYLYIPLGGNRVVKWRWHYNLIITFLVSGLWHGANWTFIIWGLIHGVFLSLQKAIGYERIGTGLLATVIKMVLNFIIACFAWIFFRANSIGDANHIITKILSGSSTSAYEAIARVGMSKPDFLVSIISICFLLLIDYYHIYQGKYVFQNFSRLVRWTLIYILLFGIVFLGIDGKAQFIYFQF